MSPRQGPHSPLSPWRWGIVAALAAFGLDQLSKWWIVAHVMHPPRAIGVLPFLDIVMVWNRGVTFGLFGAGGGRWVFVVLSFAVATVLAVWLARTTRAWSGLALGLVIGGAIGNAVDRIRFGAVADFIDLHAWGWHWPAFNVADSAIVVGVGLLLLDSFLAPQE